LGNGVTTQTNNAAIFTALRTSTLTDSQRHCSQCKSWTSGVDPPIIIY
jgi:hypothetical protein